MKSRRSLLFTFVFFTISPLIFGQSNSRQDSLTNTNYPAILIQNEDGVSSPIRLSELSIDVKVIGNIATTTMDMRFYNDFNTVREGQLYFPLGEGQTVYRFAMDVDGKLREGVIIEKNKGQEVFESIVRQSIDPGLLEWTKGNNFKARVYPIPAKGYKHIVVAYEQELSTSNYAYDYILPLNFKEEIEQFNLNVEVFNQPVQPKIDQNSLINFEFEKWQENYKASFSRERFMANRPIGISLPAPKNSLPIYTERIPGSRNSYYFYTTITPRSGSIETELPKSICLIWDASASAKNRDLVRELDLLDDYFENFSSLDIQLVLLRNDISIVKEYQVVNGEWKSLRDTLQRSLLDGASAYRSIDYSQFSCDAFLVLGDGLSNFGVANEILPKKAKITTINSSASADHSYLKYLSSMTGGEYINLLQVENNKALELLSGESLQYYGNNLKDSYPSLPTTIKDQVHVAGIIHGETKMDFSFGYGSPLSRIHLQIDPEEYLTETGLIRRIWAQKKLAELDINHEKNEEEILALGKEHGIVTRNTSLIVLDRLEDYLLHEIVPPEEMQKAYFERIAEAKKERELNKKAHLETVKGHFADYVNWWETDFEAHKILERDEELALTRELLGDSTYTWNFENGADGTVEEVQLESVEVESVSAIRGHRIAEDQNISRDGYVITGGLPAEMSDDEKVEDGKSQNAQIQLKKWEPEAEYIDALKKIHDNAIYSFYLGLKRKYANTPSFFLDVADFFIERKKPELALRILSNIAELELENHELMRILAHRLEQLEHYDLAISTYKDVLKIRQEEPQSYRDLGLCFAKNEEYQKAVDNLYKVVETPWDGRFPGIETIALIEINHILALHKRKVDVSHLDREFIKNMPVDIRVIVNWDSDNCDMDLWVTDPRGEKCFYSHNKTEIGGRISDDFTQGYGPEMFTIKEAINGEYKVQVDYYGTQSQGIAAPITIQVQLVTNFGTPEENVQEITRRLSTEKEVLDIGSLLFE